jgi:hypothetical protein
MALPALDQLRDDARLERSDAVLINDVDRLARDVDHPGIVKRDLERQNLPVIFREFQSEAGPMANLVVSILENLRRVRARTDLRPYTGAFTVDRAPARNITNDYVSLALNFTCTGTLVGFLATKSTSLPLFVSNVTSVGSFTFLCASN